MSLSNYDWIVAQGPELFEQYRGKWIAVHGGRVVGIGDTATEAAAQARDQEHIPVGEYTLMAIDERTDVIYGGI